MHFASVPTVAMFTKLVQSAKTPQVSKWMLVSICKRLTPSLKSIYRVRPYKLKPSQRSHPEEP